MSDTSRIAEILGLAALKHKGVAPMDLVGAVEKGLPFATLSRVFEQIAPDEPTLRYRVVKRSTFSRTRTVKGARLTREQSDQVARVARLWARALEVWKEPQEARDFLLKPHTLLAGRRPIDVALTTEGARLVEGILGGLLYGSAI